ncbi:MAG: FAD-binding oxidoreductase [Dehalococcoidia bacterium]|nr:FAD-binding oxidoreductase [Dehalococcoidia bacterium]
MAGASLLKSLQALVGPSRVSTDQDELAYLGADAEGRFRHMADSNRLGRPLAVVRPRSTEDVQRIMELAQRAGMPVVPRGGGTGVSGAGAAVKGGIVLDLKGLNAAQVDVGSRTVQAGAGMVLEDLQRQITPSRLIVGHDPWSFPIATVGGAISTNGVGYMAAKYGPMGDQVLGLEVVLPNGSVIQTKGIPKAAGPGFTPLFVGAEGTMGVITKAALQLFPVPEKRVIRAFGFKAFEPGFESVLDMYQHGLTPTVMDFAEEPFESDSGDLAATLYLGFDGLKEEVDVLESRGRQFCEVHGGRLQPQKQADHFWRTRHRSGENYKREVLGKPFAERRRRGWRMEYLHVAIPASRVLEYQRWSAELLSRRKLPVHEWSLWARPELFSFLIEDPESDTGVRSETLRITSDELLERAQDLGGSMEYCHGVGLRLGRLMSRELGSTMGLYKGIRAAIDSAGIMNPGKLGL